MFRNQLIAISFFCLTLSACADPMVVVGQPGPAVESEAVVLYYTRRPSCNFETLAWFQGGVYYSLQSMFDDMRREAAQIGASGVYVIHTQKTDMREILGTAKAIRCLPA